MGNKYRMDIYDVDGSRLETRMVKLTPLEELPEPQERTLSLKEKFDVVDVATIYIDMNSSEKNEIKADMAKKEYESYVKKEDVLRAVDDVIDSYNNTRYLAIKVDLRTALSAIPTVKDRT